MIHTRTHARFWAAEFTNQLKRLYNIDLLTSFNSPSDSVSAVLASIGDIPIRMNRNTQAVTCMRAITVYLMRDLLHYIPTELHVLFSNFIGLHWSTSL